MKYQMFYFLSSSSLLYFWQNEYIFLLWFLVFMGCHGKVNEYRIRRIRHIELHDDGKTLTITPTWMRFVLNKYGGIARSRIDHEHAGETLDVSISKIKPMPDDNVHRLYSYPGAYYFNIVIEEDVWYLHGNSQEDILNKEILNAVLTGHKIEIMNEVLENHKIEIL